jgi:acyl-coenzyme A synthetase/AMP-(fatty) acid ligase
MSSTASASNCAAADRFTQPVLALIAPAGRRRPLAWRGARGISQQQFLHDVQTLAARLPPAAQAFNLCEDRYRFMVAFAAVCLRGQTNLLPPSQSPGAISDIARAYPGCYALGDASDPGLSLPWIKVAETPRGTAAQQPVPSLPEDHVAALVFTSGSTGVPQPHAKTWRTLVRTAQLAAQRFAGNGPRGASIVATVPPQHMYGLETTVMMALAGGCTAHAGRSFFPAELREALEQMPAPRVLITTPVHLRVCLAAALPLPSLQLIVCATAVLDPALAAAAEAALGAPVHEIYGCTEAGSVATRRTVATPIWRLYPGMQLSHHDGVDWVTGEQLATPVMLPDLINNLGDGHFQLCGRSGDMLKVAGKRSSLGELTARLLQVPGVRDAVVFVPEPSAGREARPAALVVAPELSEVQILAALETLIDPLFLPRPLIRVSCLPRNAVGKLPRAALLAELERHRG